jgi:hypothetical protein
MLYQKIYLTNFQHQTFFLLPFENVGINMRTKIAQMHPIMIFFGPYFFEKFGLSQVF